MGHAANRAPLIVCTFGRSGTHLLIDIVRRQFAPFDTWHWPGERMNGLYISLEAVTARRCPEVRIRQILKRSQRAIIKSHDWPAARTELATVAPGLAHWLEAQASVVYVIRNPIMAITRLWAAGFADNGPDGTAESFVADQAERWALHVRAALDEPGALIVNFEDILAQPAAVIGRLSRFLGEPAQQRQPLLIAPYRNRFEYVLGRFAMRPQSSHVLPPARWKPDKLDWSPARLAILRETAGAVARDVGYRVA